jgi:hypothetical protein
VVPNPTQLPSPLASIAQDLLSLSSPKTLTFLPGLGKIWDMIPIQMDIRNAIAGSNWSRLSFVQFIDGSCSTRSPEEEKRNTCLSFPVGVQSPSVSFSWAFSLERGVHSKALARRNLGVLPTLETVGVCAHPSVRGNGIELVVGDKMKDQEAVAGDREDLPERLRSLVRY